MQNLTPLRDVNNTSPASQVMVTVCTPPCVQLWKLNSPPLCYSWVSWGAWRDGRLFRATCLVMAASGQSPGPCILTKLSSWCLCSWFSAEGFMPFLTTYLDIKACIVACILSLLIPLKLSGCSQRRLWDSGGFELCASNSVIPCQSTGRVYGTYFPGAKRECLWYYKIDCVCLSKLNSLFTAWHQLTLIIQLQGQLVGAQ